MVIKLENEMRGGKHLLEKIDRTPLGNEYYYKQGKDGRKKVMFLAHKDHVGFIVMKKAGDVLIAKGYGSIGRQIGESAILVSENGSFGILKKTNEEDIFHIDCLDKTIGVGDFFRLYRESVEDEQRVYGACLDNDVCVDLLCSVLREKEEFLYDTYFVLTEKEEIGGAGACAAIRKIEPDVAIVVDVMTANNPSFQEHEFTNVTVGKGMTILLSDGATLTGKEETTFLEKVAKDLSVPYQIAVIAGGGTDLAAFDRLGSPARRFCVGVPIGNLHSDCEYCDKRDIAALRTFLLNVDRYLL